MPFDLRRDLPRGFDPRLQRIYRQWKSGARLHEPGVVRKGPHGEAEVEVLVQLAPAAPPPPELRTNRLARPGAVVSGRVDIGALERLALDPAVARIEAARRLNRTLAVSIPEIGAESQTLGAQFPAQQPPYDGTGVVIGILDVGCDVAHPNFLKNGNSRILYLWRQATGAQAQPPPEYGYGMEYTKAQIDAALAAGQPYGPLLGNVKPQVGSHGTNVMDIAAGNGQAPNSKAGVAPNADLIFVEVDTDDVGEADFMGNSARLWQAAQYVFRRAEALGRPAVVNISLGTNGGPHDGTALADLRFDAMLDRPGRAIVIAAGNGFQSNCHASGEIAPGGAKTLSWKVNANDDTGNELEVWYGGGPLDVFVIEPGGTAASGPVSLGQSDDFDFGGFICRLTHAQDVTNGAKHVNIFLDFPPIAGTWKVRLKNVGSAAALLDAWIERDEGSVNQSRFGRTSVSTARTLGSLSCGKRPIVVGAYPADTAAPAVSTFTSAGKTRDDRTKPDICAPGEDSAGVGINAAKATTNGLVRWGGTSQAAPHVTGVIALMMQAAGRPLGIEEIRAALTSTARPASGAWDARAGFGRVDAVGAILKVLPS